VVAQNHHKINFNFVTMELILRFTARQIANLEKEQGRGLGAILNDLGVFNLVSIVQYGVGCTQNDAYDKVDAFLVDHDIEDLQYTIMKALQDQGFLARKMPLEKMKSQATAFYDKIGQTFSDSEISA
jgi:hypothetical protein